MPRSLDCASPGKEIKEQLLALLMRRIMRAIIALRSAPLAVRCAAVPHITLCVIRI